MAGTLWSVTATKSAGKLTRGMTVEILVVGTMARPSAKREPIEKYRFTAVDFLDLAMDFRE